MSRNTSLQTRTNVKPSSQGEKTLHHPNQELISQKEKKEAIRSCTYFHLGDTVTLNSLLRRALIHFASTSSLSPLRLGEDDNIAAIRPMSSGHLGPRHYKGHTSTNAWWPCWELNLQSLPALPPDPIR